MQENITVKKYVEMLQSLPNQDAVLCTVEIVNDTEEFNGIQGGFVQLSNKKFYNNDCEFENGDIVVVF